MHLVVGEIKHTANKSSKKSSASLDGKPARFKERRKNEHDRRKSVRDGVFVSFSFKDDRRVLRKRRQTQ
jgi:hypothetical protein